MRGKQFSWLLSGATALGAALAVILMRMQVDRASDSPGERALCVGGFFLVLFVLGFCALQLAMALNKTYKVARPPLWWVYFLAACALLFGIGVGGQYLFMYSREEVTVAREVDMVLLLDVSSSMDVSGFNAPRTDAACQFVDSLGEDCRLQAVSFGGRVLDSTPLLPMNSANKDALKQMIRTIDTSGATDFNEPLQQAMDTLNSEGRPNGSKAVILLTDGQSGLDSGVVGNLLNSDIRVFTVRISSTPFMGSFEQGLADLAQNTGGFDTLLMPRSDGSLDTADMLRAFQDAFQATSETEVNMSEDLIVYAEYGVTFWQILIRTLVMVLCAVLVGIGYFGQIRLPAVISNGVMGLLASILVCVLEGTGFFLCGSALCLLVGTAYVFLDLRGEDHYDV